MLEVKQADYIRTARAKGIKEYLVVWRHTVRNAILPIVTMIGFTLPTLVAGALFTETIYSWPGMGALFGRRGVSARLSNGDGHYAGHRRFRVISEFAD